MYSRRVIHARQQMIAVAFSAEHDVVTQGCGEVDHRLKQRAAIRQRQLMLRPPHAPG